MEVKITSNADLSRLLKNSAFMQRSMRKAVRQVLTKARKDTQRAIHGAVPNDPRAAYKAVRQLNYKKDFGGNLNILPFSKAMDKMVSLPPKGRIQGAGGNRLRRSERTEALMTYYGRDRGFVLRFLNKGVASRKSKYGNRGKLPKMFDFKTIATEAINKHMGEMQKTMDKELAKF